MSIGVKVKHGNLEKALRIFKKKIKNSGVLEEYKNKREYVKKSTEKRAKKKLAINRQKRYNSMEY